MGFGEGGEAGTSTKVEAREKMGGGRDGIMRSPNKL